MTALIFRWQCPGVTHPGPSREGRFKDILFFVCSHIILSFSWVLKWYFGVRIRRPWSPYFSYLSSQFLTIWQSRCRALHRLERGRPLLICLTMFRFSSKVCFIIALFLLGFLSNFLGALHSREGSFGYCFLFDN